MVRARVWAGAAVASATAAVAVAGWMMTLPREETWFFAPQPFNSPGFVAGCGLLGLVWAAVGAVLVGARPRRRQQLALLVCGVMPFLAASMFTPVTFANMLVFLSLLLVPVAVAVGVLRYRLLGIETALRRGLVYGMFTAAVVAAYLVVTAVAGAAGGA